MSRLNELLIWLSDKSISLVLLVLNAPILFIVAAAVAVKDGLPVLFVQERIGRGEEPFRLYKFRTMTVQNGRPEVTRLGALLRGTSLDELPQLWNVLSGKMSLVGPRPLLPRYLEYYRPDERCRHDVRPGMTGLAQISGRNRLSWDERLALDGEWVQNRSFAMYASILVRTGARVLRGMEVDVEPNLRMKPLDEERRTGSSA